MKKAIRIIFVLLIILALAGMAFFYLHDEPEFKVFSSNIWEKQKDYEELDQFRDSVLYEQLNEQEKYIYRSLYFNSRDNIYEYAYNKDYTLDEVERALAAFTNEYPEYYYLSIDGFTEYTNDLFSLSCILGSFENQSYEISRTIEQFEEKAETILKDTEADDEYERIRKIHDYVLDHVEYDAECSNSQDLRSALLNGRAVCAGYAKMFQYLVQKAGYECIYVSGTVEDSETPNHAWDLLKFHDHWYWIDQTLDDTAGIPYDYFFADDELMLENHKPEEFVYPACDDASYYFKDTGVIYFTNSSRDEIRDYILTRVIAGDSPISMKFSDQDDYEIIRDYLYRGESVIHFLSNLSPDLQFGSFEVYAVDERKYLSLTLNR